MFVVSDIIVSVIIMELFKNITVTDIKAPVTVFSEKGRIDSTRCRRYYGISLCIDGQITYTMNGKKYVSDKTNCVLLPKGGAYTLRGDKEGLFPVINFDCTGLCCDEIMLIPLNDPQKCLNDYEMIKKLFSSGKSRLKVYSMFYELLNKISAPKRSEKSILSPLNSYIESNFGDSTLSNTELADKLGISEVYLRKLFISEYGTTPKQYILNFRISKAKEMLTDTNLTVTQISERCGFSSLYHFCRAFKDKTGITPTQYAENNKIYKI